MYEYYIRIAPGIMINELMVHFSVGATAIGTLAGFYFYAYTPMQIVVGPLLDRFKVHHLLTFAVVVCALGCILVGVAPTGFIAFAYAGRFLQGLGSAFAFVGILKLGSMILPNDRLALVSGIITSLGFIGAMAGQDSLTVLVDHFSWQSTLIGVGIFGFILTPIFFIYVRNPNNKQGNQETVTTRELLQGLWMTVKQPYLWVVGLIGGILFMPNSVFVSLWGIPFLEHTQHLQKSDAIFACSLVFLGWAVGSPIQGWLSDKLQARMRLLFLGAIVAAGIMFTILYQPGLSYKSLCVLFFLFGLFSSAQVSVFPLAIEFMPKRYSGTAIAFVNFLTMLGGLTMQRGIGVFLDHEWSGHLENGLRVYSNSDYQNALAIIPVLLLGAAALSVCAYLMRSRHSREPQLSSEQSEQKVSMLKV
ncbi:MFS transporter [Dongshaea marina]|uniref:MFS transporter n=1 Tax=Dongshaea marina TaxID=2047966 RepID=UPI000D3E3DCD|nr:MFS transporter [Dongshaea marina]